MGSGGFVLGLGMQHFDLTIEIGLLGFQPRPFVGQSKGIDFGLRNAVHKRLTRAGRSVQFVSRNRLRLLGSQDSHFV